MTSSAGETWLFRLASYANWHTDGRHARQLFAGLDALSLNPEKLDDRNPPRRKLRGDESDIKFWLEIQPADWSRWLFLRKKEGETRFSIVLQMKRYEMESMKRRGDYSFAYGEIETANSDDAQSVWRTLCASLEPFHAHMDRTETVTIRERIWHSDGRTDKPRATYFRFLPGLFAFNYYGPVYAEFWENRLADERLPQYERDARRGFYLTLPPAPAVDLDPACPYTDAEQEIIRILGEECFHIPSQPDETKRGPRLPPLR